MIEKDMIHFYLFKPVQLQDERLVVPVYFYRCGHEIVAKCVFAFQRFVNKGISTRIRTEFPYVSNFDSPVLTTSNITEFWRTFDGITFRNGQSMKDHCGDFMYGEFSQVSPRGAQS